MLLGTINKCRRGIKKITLWLVSRYWRQWIKGCLIKLANSQEQILHIYSSKIIRKCFKCLNVTFCQELYSAMLFWSKIPYYKEWSPDELGEQLPDLPCSQMRQGWICFRLGWIRVSILSRMLAALVLWKTAGWLKMLRKVQASLRHYHIS